MNKRSKMLLVSILLLSLIVFTSVTAYAQTVSKINWDIERSEAVSIGLWFIANDININSNSLWDKDTRIYKITELYDTNDNVTGYCIELTKGKEYNGYIVVSGSSDSSSIQEFSYTAEPLFYAVDKDNIDKVIYTGPMEYYVESRGVLKGLDKKNVSKDEVKSRFQFDETRSNLNRKNVNNIRDKGLFNENEWMMGYNGQISGQSGYGGIYDPYAYVNDRYGSGWQMIAYKKIPNVYPHLQNDFKPNVNNCTLSSITTVFEYWRNQGKTNIPSNLSTLYSDVETIALQHGYTDTGGTSPTEIDDIVSDLWSHYSYSGYGSNLYVWSYNSFTSEADNNRPGLINISFGYYGNHSVTLVGYQTYYKTFSFDKGFLQVYDNWTTNDRYIDYAEFVNSTTASLTRIYP